MDEKILVFGGFGLVGSRVVAKLLARGYKVSVFDASVPPGTSTHALFREQFLAGCTHVIQGDISRATDLQEAMALVQPDRLVHLAAVPHPPEDIASIRAALNTVLPPIETLLSHTQRFPIKRFLFGSTSNVYGPFQYAPADERHPKEPYTVYGSLKLAAELFTRSLALRLGVPYTIVRLITVYGPGAMAGKFSMAKLLRILQTGEYPTGSQSDMGGTDFTYVEDAAEGVVLALLTEVAAGEDFNIACGRARTAEDVIGALRALGFDVRAVAKAEAAQSESPKRGALSIEKARGLLGYSPQFGLEQGLVPCVEYLHRYEGLGVEGLPVEQLMGEHAAF